MTELCEELCEHCRMSRDVKGLRRCSRMLAESPRMRDLMVRAARIAGSHAPVILLGESGTGKEALARVLHANSPRAEMPFIPVNVGALPTELLESELFGHVRGAFSGAVADKQGLFAAADGGTLFLDEIAEMPLALQVKLLRVLQEGEVRRVGEPRPFTVDVRIFCATHRDVERQVQEGLFRQDLYYRLKVFTLVLPPLRERVEDILPLARQFLEVERTPVGRISPAAQRLLEGHRWPGNVRELANAMKHAAVFARRSDIEPEHLPDDVAGNRPVSSNPGEPLRSLAEVEREHILRVLEACGGRQVEVTRILGISRATLWRKLASYGLSARH